MWSLKSLLKSLSWLIKAYQCLYVCPFSRDSETDGQWQRTWNDFELRRTFWPANHESLAGHFEISSDIYVRWKRKPSPDIFNISSPDILLNFLLPDILSGENWPLRRTFEISPDMWPADLTYSADRHTVSKLINYYTHHIWDVVGGPGDFFNLIFL